MHKLRELRRGEDTRLLEVRIRKRLYLWKWFILWPMVFLHWCWSRRCLFYIKLFRILSFVVTCILAGSQYWGSWWNTIFVIISWRQNHMCAFFIFITLFKCFIFLSVQNVCHRFISEYFVEFSTTRKECASYCLHAGDSFSRLELILNLV